jgi:hypothetical protein
MSRCLMTIRNIIYCGVFAQTVAKQRLRKQISTERLFSLRSASRTLRSNAEVNTSLLCYATLRQLVDTQQWEMREKFSVQSAQRLYNATLVGHQTLTRVGSGSNTSTVTLRVVGGDEKGSLKSETKKYGHGSEMTRTRERLRWPGPAAYTKDRPDFSSERAPQENQTIKVKV